MQKKISGGVFIITIRAVAGVENSSAHREFQISSAADLADLPTNLKKSPVLNIKCAVGSIAYTAGFKQIWHLSDTGEWVEV